MNRREFLYVLGGLGALKAGSVGYEWASFASDPTDYIQPHHTAVEQQAEAIDSLPETADIDTELTYDRDIENFKPASVYLEDGTGDCEDTASLAASILENKQIPWKMVFQAGHTETHFYMDGDYHRWHSGQPKNPEERDGEDFDLMFDLDDGWDTYDEDWA